MSTLKSLLRDRRTPLMMDGRKDGGIEIHVPEELKTIRLRVVDGKGATIRLGEWMGATKGGIPDWEKKYYMVSALMMMANNQRTTFSPSAADTWDAAFYLGLMWARFEKKRGGKVELEEVSHTADEMDAIVKRFTDGE